MKPFRLSAERLVLDQPTADDVDVIATHCSDPVFETFMITPWPYERQHAEWFVGHHVPNGWSTESEWTWAIRGRDDRELLGAISVRLPSGMLGFWLGAPHRGRGIMVEAVSTVVDAVFEHTALDEVLWECVVGNRASSRVAEKSGFRFTGKTHGIIPGRDGTLAPAWTGRLARDDERTPKSGWPA